MESFSVDVEDDTLQMGNGDGSVLEGVDHRLLQANFTETAGLTDTEILRTTCKLYGSIFAVLFVLFLLVRNMKPEIFNLKKTCRELSTPVAEVRFPLFFCLRQSRFFLLSHSFHSHITRITFTHTKQEFHGPISWIWKVFGVSYNTIAEECGMDAATTIRLFELGVKLSLVGVFNSIFLFPVYKFSGDQVTMATYDPVKQLSLSNMKQGNIGTIATTVAAYIIFGVAMHLIDKDFEWFTSMRHRFLAKKRAQNYSLFISSIPESLCNDEALQQYFRSFTGEDVVIDGDVAIDIPKLEKKVARRDVVVAKLEHAINVLTIKGTTPMHKTKMCGGEKVESVPAYTEELEQLNKDISKEVGRIVAFKEECGREATADPEAVVVAALATTEDLTGNAGEEETKMDEPALAAKDAKVHSTCSAKEKGDEEEETKSKRSVTKMVSTKLSRFLEGDDDGKARTAAFVTFKDLASTNLARQAVHSSEPWEFVPAEPPNPQFVNWKNVGKGNHKRKIGQLVSLFLTVLLCVFWTIPVSLVASLSNVEALTEIFPFLLEPVMKYDWFANLLAQLAPLILTVFISLLPHFLLAFVKLECLVEIESMQHPSLFSKLAFFTLIQTFFISTISGSLWSSLEGEHHSVACYDQEGIRNHISII